MDLATDHTRPGRWLDAAAAGLTAGTLIGTLQIGPDHPGERAPDTTAWVVTLVCAAALLVVRRHPAAVGAVAAALGYYYLVPYPAGPLLIAGPLAVALVGVPHGWRPALLSALAVGACAFGGHLIAGGYAWSTRAALLIGWLGLGVLAGQVGRLAADRLAERGVRRAEEDRRARAEERLRMAHDLHDSLGHALSLIAIQSRVAAADLPPGRSRDALAVVTQASTAAIDEVRNIVEALRDDAPRRPPGTLAAIDLLVTDARGAGQSVVLATTGATTHAASVEAAAYRVVQEALTNARRHAPGRPVRVQVDRGETLRVRVTNAVDRPATGAAGDRASGLGLTGIRERVRATGGTASAGVRDEATWEVAATWKT